MQEWSTLSTVADGHEVVLSIATDAAALRDALLAVLVPDGVDALPLIAETRRSRVARLEVDGRRLVIKRYTEPGLYLLRTFLRASRAQREAGALDLLGRALPDNAVRPLAWAEQRRRGFVPRSWIVTTELVAAVNLRHVDDLPALERAVLLDALPRRVAALHRAGIVARTLHAKNVLVQPGTGALAFIDLPLARSVGGGLSTGQRTRDLACLVKGLRRSLAHDEVTRLCTAYVQAAGLDLEPTQWIARVVRVADVLDNRTPVAGAVHGLRLRLGRSWLGRAAGGGAQPR
jgi:tRNA A-37 threonylcarbamoyl transferase component Bud32